MPLLNLYTAATSMATPVLERLLRKRLAQGREKAERLSERRGIATIERPSGDLIWLHAASVGESLSVLPLVKRLNEDLSGTSILVTSGTVTSANLLADMLPDGVIHQFVPLDQPRWVAAFLDHWKPSAALWVESELWPNLLRQTAARKIPLALINARISEKSYQRWSRARSLSRSLLKSFDFCLAQDSLQAERLARLGAKSVKAVGNLKFAGQHLNVDSSQLSQLQKKIKGRPVWMAASTHEGEELAAIKVHKELQKNHKDLLTFIVPRHPERAADVKKELRQNRLRFSSWSKSKAPHQSDQVFLVDTLGDLPFFCALSPICFMGGSMNVGAGGHNLIEPARLASALIYGPDMGNFALLSESFVNNGAALQVRDTNELVDAVDSLLVDEEARERQIAAASALAEKETQVLDAVYKELSPLFVRAAIQTKIGRAKV